MSNFIGPNIIRDSMILCLDATNPRSYPGSGSVWYDISGNGNHFNVNPNAFNSSGKYFDFKGSYGCAKTNSDISLSGNVTYIAVTRIKNSTAEWRTLTRSYNGDHHVIVQSGDWNIGVYDNDSSGFISTGFSQQSLPGYQSNQFDFMAWRWSYPGTPTHDFHVNGIDRGSISNSNAQYNRGFGSLGGYHNGTTNVNDASQYWGDIQYFAVYNKRLTNKEIRLVWNGLRARIGAWNYNAIPLDETVYYDEGATALTAFWNNNNTYYMNQFGGLGNVTAHGGGSGPQTFTLTLNGLPSHSSIRYQVYWHLVDSLDNETNYLYLTDNTGNWTEYLRFTKVYNSSPNVSVLASGASANWSGGQPYTYQPWGGGAYGNDGYILFDSGWYNHSQSSFSAQHNLNYDQSQGDEAQYLSHVKVMIRG